MAHLAEAARLRSQTARAALQHGRNVVRAGESAGRRSRHFEAAIAIDANFSPAHNNLGAVLWSQRKLKEASECFCRAVTINPNYAEAVE